MSEHSDQVAALKLKLIKLLLQIHLPGVVAALVKALAVPRDRVP
jgi:hypothetical protein